MELRTGVVEPAIEVLRKLPIVQRVEFAGSLRRRKETVHDVDIVLATDDAAAVMDAFARELRPALPATKVSVPTVKVCPGLKLNGT